MKLKDITCKNAKGKDKPYKLSDGGGLYLLIKPNGSKLWRMKYRFPGVSPKTGEFKNLEKTLSFGPYPHITLGEAREQRENAKRLLAKNIDPAAHKEAEKNEIIRNAENTFKAVAQDWLEAQKPSWSEGYTDKIQRILEMHIYPDLGQRPISEINPPELLACLKKIVDNKTYEIAGRAKQICGMIFRYGIQNGKCERDSAADLKGAWKRPKTEHFRTIESKQLPEFLRALEKNEARLFERTRRALWFSLLTFARPGEIRQAQWSEIDWEAKEWRVSASKMKMRRDHIVPLSRQALGVLKEQYEETGGINTDWIFPSQVKPRNPMSDGTVNRAIDRLGYGKDMVAHGIRALARTTIREKLGYDSEVIEKQLAHMTSNPLGEAYDRTQFLDKRAPMMQEWADYLEAITSEGKVVSLAEQGMKA